MSIRVAVMNECDLVVAGVEALLAPYPHRIQVVDLDAGTPPLAQVDVLLFDPSFTSPGRSPDPRGSTGRGCLVALGWDLDPDQVRAIVRTGVDAYIVKGLPAAEFVDAIERAFRGEAVLPAKADAPTDVVTSRRWPGDEVGIREREAAVLSLICQGLSNSGIAERLSVSPNTVKTYIRSAYRKIGVRTRSEAVIWGIANGLAGESTAPPSDLDRLLVWPADFSTAGH